MENIQYLIDLGLSEKEAKIYLTLLERESATSGELIKTLNYYSKTVYEALNKLIEKGLVGYVIKSNKKYFTASDPDKFLDILKEEEFKIKDKKEHFAKIIDLLRKKRRLSHSQQEANIYFGSKGIKSIFEDSLKENKEIIVIGAGGKFKEVLDSYSKLWHKLRIKKKIKLRLLWSEKLRNKKDEIKDFKLIELKFLPDEFDNPAPVMIFKNKVAITVWSEQPIATLIRSKEVSQSFKKYFELLWKLSNE